MAERLGTAVLELRTDSKQYNLDVRKARGQAQQLDASFQRTGRSLKRVGMGVAKVAKGLAVGLGAALAASTVKTLKFTAALEKQAVSFEVMLGSAERARALMDDLKRFSTSTPFQLADINEGAKRLLAFGTAAEDVVAKMRQLGNAAQGNSEKLDRLVDAYGKLQAKGRASMEELNRFTEAGVPLMAALERQIGVTSEELFDMVTRGEIGFEEVDAALVQLTTDSGQFAGMLEKQSKTLGGLWSTFKDNVSLISSEIATNFTPKIKSALSEVITFMQENKDSIVGIFTNLPGIAKLAFKAIGQMFIRTFSSETRNAVFDAIGNYLVNTFRASLALIGDLWENAMNALADTGEQLGSDWWKYLINGITSSVTNGGPVGKWLIERLTGVEWTGLEFFDTQGISFGQAFGNALLEEGENFKTAYQRYFEAVSGAAGEAADAVGAEYSDIFTEFQTNVQRLIDATATPVPDPSGAGGTGGAPAGTGGGTEAENPLNRPTFDHYASRLEEMEGKYHHFGATATTVLERIQAAWDANSEKLMEHVGKVQDFSARMTDLSGRLSAVFTANAEAATAQVQDQVQRGIISQEQGDKQLTEIRRKQAKREKRIATFEAFVNTISAATKALTAGPIAGPILAASIAALGFAQMAAIQSKPIPAMAEGGLVMDEAIVRVAEKEPEIIGPVDKVLGRANGQPALSISGDVNLYGAGGMAEFAESVADAIQRGQRTGAIGSLA